MKEAENIFLTYAFKTMQGVSGRMACVRFSFCLSHPLLPDIPNPPTHEVFFECIKLIEVK